MWRLAGHGLVREALLWMTKHILGHLSTSPESCPLALSMFSGTMKKALKWLKWYIDSSFKCLEYSLSKAVLKIIFDYMCSFFYQEMGMDGIVNWSQEKKVPIKCRCLSQIVGAAPVWTQRHTVSSKHTFSLATWRQVVWLNAMLLLQVFESLQCFLSHLLCW